MTGRYGSDQLSLALLILGMVASLLANAASSFLLTVLSYIIFAAIILRVLSKDTVKRRAENERFMQWWSPIGKKMTAYFNSAKDLKRYKFFKCPGCGQKIRAPRGRGKILITCQKCKTKFEAKT